MFVSGKQTNTIYKACIYARLSRDDDDKDKTESDSITNQKALIHEYLKHCKDIKVVAEKTDDGYSGVNFNRPGFEEMMELVRKGKVNCIIVKDLSRFGRNYIEVGKYIERFFPFMNIRFIAINDGYDSLNAKQRSSDLLIPFKNLINDAYCNDISVKTRTQLEVKRKKGQFLGSQVSYGYLKDPADHNHLVVDPYASEIVKTIFMLKIKGYSQNAIANRLNEKQILCPMEYKVSGGKKINTTQRRRDQAVWAATTITRILTNEVYRGCLVQGKVSTPNYKVKKQIVKDKSEWIRVENTHEAIISEEDFALVQKLLEQDVRVAAKKDSVYLFSGFLKCGDCGMNMIRKTVPYKGRTLGYFVCSTKKTGKGCSWHNISETSLYEAVLEVVRAHIETIAKMEEAIKKMNLLAERNSINYNYEAEIERLQKNIQTAKTMKLRLYESLENGIVTHEEYISYRRTYDRRINETQIAIENLTEERKRISDAGKGMGWADNFLKYRYVKELDRTMIAELIDHIEIYEDNRIIVCFNYADQYQTAATLLQQASMQNPEQITGTGV